MKKYLKRIVCVIAVGMLAFGVFTISSAALYSHDYSFDFDQTLTNNMDYSPKYLRDTGNANVFPDYSTTGTMYFMSPQDYGYLQATNVVSISTRIHGYFTWYSGYGGSNQWYCLAGCPDNAWWPWTPYSITGVFFE